jgi:hypothetical protein
MYSRIRQILVVVFAVLEIGSSVWLGDRLDQEAAPTPVYFLPFGPTFAIWGLIFASGLVYAIYQALPGQGERRLHRRIGWWVALNAVFTTLWNVTAGMSEQPDNAAVKPILVWGTVGILAGMLFALTQAFIVLREMHDELTPRDRWLAQFPVTVFFAWLNVAMIANTTAALAAAGVTAEPYSSLWAAGMLLIAAVVASAMIRFARPGVGRWTYTAVVLWAIIGIFFNTIDRSLLVASVCVIVALLVVGVAVLHMAPPNRQHPPDRQPGSLA